MKLNRIRTGLFTRAYKINNKNVLLHSVCLAKHCNAELGFGDNYLFPEIEKITYQTFKMPFYNVGSKKGGIRNKVSARQWRLYKALRNLSVYCRNNYDLGQAWERAFESLPSEFKNEKRYLIEALNSFRNYTCFPCFEISPRNIAIKGNKIVLLDCFFCLEQSRKVRTGKEKLASEYEFFNQ